MLQLNVSQMLKSPIGEVRRVSLDDTIDVSGYGHAAVQGEATLTHTNRSILVKAVFTATLTFECARCLMDYSCPLAVEFTEEYFPSMDVTSGSLLPDPEEPEAFTVDEHLTLDLSEAVRQYILTAIPMKPLCRLDCPGIRV